MDLLERTASADALILQVTEMIAARRLGVARPLLAAIRQIVPTSERLVELSASLAMCEHRYEDAQSELDQAIETGPDRSRLRILRAQLRVDTGDLVGAAKDAAEAVIQDCNDPAAKALLGMLMLELGNNRDALACLSEAVDAAPNNPSFREGLAAAEEANGQPDIAVATLATGIGLTPGRVELRSAAILLHVRHRDFTAAVRLAEEARIAGVADACVFGLKGHALSSLGRHEEAGDAYREALKLGPNDPYVRHLVASSGFLPGAKRAPPEYLSTIFDGYAPRFETHLIELGYRIPGLVRAAVGQHLKKLDSQTAEQRLGPVLDLGCGTGLLALVLADLPVGPFTGVDLSGRMLAHAQSKGIYTQLQCSDLMSFLAEDEQLWGVVLAGDVFCYFGDLDEVFSSVYGRLAPGGLFLFSVEELLPDAAGDPPANMQGDAGWSLGRQGRYSHTEEYLTSVVNSAKFTTRSLRREIQRFEAGAPVHGFFVALERPAHNV